jgi:hypothetical protein
LKNVKFEKEEPEGGPPKKDENLVDKMIEKK